MGTNILTPWHVSFGLRLRQARKRARYSTRHVAKLIEKRFQLALSHGSIARIERGEQRLSIGMLCVLCSIYEVAPIDVPSLAVAVLVLLAVAGLASFIPARRAARLDPLEGLRVD